MSQTQANYWIQTLTPILKKALSDMGHLPERLPENLEKILREEGAEEVSIDATERRCQRPKDNEKQKKYYSGKKKSHTLKNNLIVNNENRKVKYLSKTCEGKKHPKSRGRCLQRRSGLSRRDGPAPTGNRRPGFIGMC